jgi:hypothetical protein
MAQGSRSAWAANVALFTALAVFAGAMYLLFFGPVSRPPELGSGPAPVDGKTPPNVPPKLAAAGQMPRLFEGQPTPDLFLVLSGQMFGYLQPCGCSRPQLGGLERRFELMARLLVKGAPVSAADLGDFAPQQRGPQAKLKYEIGLRMLTTMSYSAVGLGLNELTMPVTEAFDIAQNYQPPHFLAANLDDSDGQFPGMFQGWTIDRPRHITDHLSFLGRWLGHAATPTPGHAELAVGLCIAARPSVGYVGLVGESVATKAKSLEVPVRFKSASEVLPAALATLAEQHVDVRVLIFQGTADEAKQLLGPRPPFDVVLTKSDADIAASLPERIGDCLVISVGHKGRSVGVVALTRGAAGSWQKQYKLVDLVEALELPDAQTNPARELMREYVLGVYLGGLLTKVTPSKHPLHLFPGMENAKFVGAAACKECHAQAYNVWAQSKHAKGYQSLIDYGRPIAQLRQKDGSLKRIGREYDPECAICHTVGFGFQGGFVDAETTPLLLGNQCENCHGPASLHVADPKNPDFFKPLRLSITAKTTEANCRRCHDGDNDPKFDLEKYWPQIRHSKVN